MRIVAGRHRGRKLSAPSGGRIRPTAERVRESLFNILQHRDWNAPIRDARVLDAFCGTGALGLEALSRGAAHATFMDNDSDAIAFCRRNIDALGEDARSVLLLGDCLRPVRPFKPCTLLLADPPYRKELAVPALAALGDAGWIARGAVCVLETGIREAAEPPPGFRMLDERRYGAARLLFLQRGA